MLACAEGSAVAVTMGGAMFHRLTWIVSASAIVVAATSIAARPQATDASFTSRFDVDKADLASSGRNPYFILEPGYVLTLEDASVRLVITVLTETKVVDGVETRIVEERE